MLNFFYETCHRATRMIKITFIENSVDDKNSVFSEIENEPDFQI